MIGLRCLYAMPDPQGGTHLLLPSLPARNSLQAQGQIVEAEWPKGRASDGGKASCRLIVLLLVCSSPRGRSSAKAARGAFSSASPANGGFAISMRADEGGGKKPGHGKPRAICISCERTKLYAARNCLRPYAGRP